MRKINIDEKMLYNGTKILSGGGAEAELLLPAKGGGIFLPQMLGFKERYLCFYAETPEDHSLSLEFNAYTDEKIERQDDSLRHEIHGIRFGIMPRFKTLICIDTKWLDGHILFPGHGPGELKVVCHGGRVRPEDIKVLILEGRPVFHDVRLRLSDFTLTDEYPVSFPIPDGKLIDELGQYKKKEWPGKTKGLEELKIKLNKILEKPDAYSEKGWSKYGGWAEKKLAAGTGFFTKLKNDGRWWILDPEGYAFFSAGPDCVNTTADCRVDDLEKTLDWLPSPDDPEYKELFGTEYKYTKFEVRPKGLVFSYPAANLKRVFGKDWDKKWGELVCKQLKSNGMNTIANWSDQRILGKVPMPYVLPLERFPETKVNIFRDFPDVLSDEYKSDAKKCAGFLKPYVNDPYLIGYFLRNEPMWAFVNNLVIADEVLYNPEPTVCKDELIKFLEKKYGNPEALSKAWKHTFSSFSELNKPLRNASAFSPVSLEDLREFSRILLNAYVSIPAQACRKVDPNHMDLGMRWAWISDPDIVSGWENFDVFSVNCYFEDPTPALDNVKNLGVDLPIMIGEFHFGALDLGLTSTGLKGTLNQKERGKAYRYYCERVAAHSCGVGCHWFQLYDQFPLGRFDGENYNIGLLDVCSLPNDEMMGAIRDCAKVIYHVAEGTKKPVTDKPGFIPMVAF